MYEGPENRVEENQTVHPELTIPVNVSISVKDIKGVTNQVG